MRIPESMVRAAQALQAIAKGKGNGRDIAEIMVAINADGRADTFGGLIGWDEVRREMRRADDALYRGREDEEDLRDFLARAHAIRDS